MRINRIKTAAVALPLAALLAACGAGDDASGPATQDQSGASGQTVSLADFEIEAPASAPAGTSFTVVNDGEAPHNWTAANGTFSTADLGSGEQATVTIDDPGTYAYTCTIHPDLMTGEIEITE